MGSLVAQSFSLFVLSSAPRKCASVDWIICALVVTKQPKQEEMKHELGYYAKRDT